jgi:NAD(P)-dependent dehydrogenase (short-subunit alcohol dehydrogenase family)
LGQLELSDPASIDSFARSFLEEHRQLDMLINCAGIMAAPLARDTRGYESQFAVNHLGHFQLTLSLWPALARAGAARVVSVSSRGHQIAGVDFEDPNFEHRPYDKWIAYGQSKTANISFAVGLDERGETDNIRAFAVHPGSIPTDLNRHLGDADLQAMGLYRDAQGSIPLDLLRQLVFDAKSVPEGAATLVWCATSPLLADKGGVYCEDCDISSLIAEDARRVPGVRPSAIDRENAARLWALSEHLIEVEGH